MLTITKKRITSTVLILQKLRDEICNGTFIYRKFKEENDIRNWDGLYSAVRKLNYIENLSDNQRRPKYVCRFPQNIEPIHARRIIEQMQMDNIESQKRKRLRILTGVAKEESTEINHTEQLKPVIIPKQLEVVKEIKKQIDKPAKVFRFTLFGMKIFEIYKA